MPKQKQRGKIKQNKDAKVFNNSSNIMKVRLKYQDVYETRLRTFQNFNVATSLYNFADALKESAEKARQRRMQVEEEYKRKLKKRQDAITAAHGTRGSQMKDKYDKGSICRS